MSSWTSQAHAFHQPVCQRLSWLHHWSFPHVHTIGVFSPSEWGPDPQCQAAQVAHWTWWWQCLAVWHCRSVWSLPCHFAADAGGMALSMALLAWSIALSTQELYTRPGVLKKRWREERTASRSLNFFQAIFTCVVVKSSQPPAAENMSPR